jgi:hypothetical protein
MQPKNNHRTGTKQKTAPVGGVKGNGSGIAKIQQIPISRLSPPIIVRYRYLVAAPLALSVSE